VPLGQDHNICIEYILIIVPVDGDTQHKQGYQIWESFILYKGEAPTAAREIAVDFWAFRISPDLMHQSVILI